ncbi:glucose-6-phosphate dehydrogenase [Brevibacillus brevis]|uniref:glucose-6-phosphate dehydrogenase n=1 Tax=Brevibacillus brevis TaxID=1393 RepID=UPI000D1075E3|nr:glucose-6-phosphate dehydrogenase [Brevibacillus brevis]PSJ70077.1 glucose-6-phosphate dehydrogenase [Brevibacillus brevis]RED29944.1 glucose-6-phosphate 1-dehydrogenase [Brevibacillus brevis]VEF88492.1 Glucose-6-phosphate 1-dehydrogenase [Brevibacillus brevis]
MEAMTFVLFGATGDLAKRKIFPALFNLYVDQKLPAAFSIIGVGRRAWSDDEFQDSVRQSVHEFSRRTEIDSRELDAFLSACRYAEVDVMEPRAYETLHHLVLQREQELQIPQNRMFYLSVAPQYFEGIATNVKASGLGSTTGWKRLIIEKPFGHDLQSAIELNEKLGKAFLEEEIYRIDHYLGKPMVQNLEALEFANPIFQALWNNQYIANVQITANEAVGVEDRAGYYDHSGALRDMLQNHMLQMLMMIAMQLPKRITSAHIREEKRRAMAAVRPIKTEEVHNHVVRGQYCAGHIQGTPVIGYRDEPGVDPVSMTETYIATRVWIDDPFWQGVPFYIRTGKRLQEKSTRIVIEFKNPHEQLYQEQNETTLPNLLIISVNPYEGIALQVNRKNPTNSGKIEPVTVDFSAGTKDVPEAYELLLFDALRGDSTYFAHWDEVRLSWEWVTPILEAFAENLVPLFTYEAGSFGPKAAEQLLEADGFVWWLDKVEERVPVTATR